MISGCFAGDLDAANSLPRTRTQVIAVHLRLKIANSKRWPDGYRLLLSFCESAWLVILLLSFSETAYDVIKLLSFSETAYDVVLEILISIRYTGTTCIFQCVRLWDTLVLCVNHG